MHQYAEKVIDKINQSIIEQKDKLNKATLKLADSVENGGILHVLGTGHSHMIAEEVFYRAGGPMFVNPILDSGFMLHEGAAKSTHMERLTGYADAIFTNLDLSEHDVFLAISNSGRNNLPIEATYYMKKRDIFTISISSFAHSQSVESRHSSGKRLFEITDLSIDNYGEIGDAALSLGGSKEKYGPTSSAIGIVLIQTLMSMTIEELANRGEKPPLMRSANLDGSDEGNRVLMKKYGERIPLLR